MTSALAAGRAGGRLRAILAAAAALFSLLFPPPASAQNIQVELTASRVSKLADGHEQLRPASEARPGELIEYHVRYRNTGASRAQRVEATLPIPRDTVYEATDRLPVPLASLDGRHFEPVPLRRVAVQPDGRKVLVTVPLSEYRYLRWPLGDLARDQGASVRARVRVQSNAPTGPAAAGARP